MWKKLKSLLDELESLDTDVLSAEQKQIVISNLYVQIQFFQHERLVHLIVTVLFSLLSLINMININITGYLLFYILELLLISLLVPYIIHYYRLENGVQKLYFFYEKLSKEEKT